VRKTIRGVRVALVAPERFAGWAGSEGIPLLPLPERERSLGELAARLDRILDGFRPDLLLVDVFPRGVIGELEEPLARHPVRSWLVARKLSAQRRNEPGLAEWSDARHERLFRVEPPPEGDSARHPHEETIPPILIRRPDECLRREKARRLLGIGSDERLLLAIGTGAPSFQRDLLSVLLKAANRIESRSSVSGPVSVRFLSFELPEGGTGSLRVLSHFPAMELFRAADALVISGGYASVHEALALGLDPVVVPQPRPADLQHERAAGLAVPRSPEELEAQLAERLANPPGPSRPEGPVDGATLLAERIREVLGG
jgi:predicted glycosyltransferase